MKSIVDKTSQSYENNIYLNNSNRVHSSVDSYINIIINETNKILLEKELNKQILDKSIGNIFNQIEFTAQTNFINIDSGENDFSNCLWEQEEEPTPELIDYWAKVALPIVGKPKSLILSPSEESKREENDNNDTLESEIKSDLVYKTEEIIIKKALLSSTSNSNNIYKATAEYENIFEGEINERIKQLKNKEDEEKAKFLEMKQNLRNLNHYIIDRDGQIVEIRNYNINRSNLFLLNTNLTDLKRHSTKSEIIQKNNSVSNNSQPSFQSRDLSSLYASITPNPGVQVSDGKNKKTFNAADSSQTIERSSESMVRSSLVENAKSRSSIEESTSEINFHNSELRDVNIYLTNSDEWGLNLESNKILTPVYPKGIKEESKLRKDNIKPRKFIVNKELRGRKHLSNPANEKKKSNYHSKSNPNSINHTPSESSILSRNSKKYKSPPLPGIN